MLRILALASGLAALSSAAAWGRSELSAAAGQIVEIAGQPGAGGAVVVRADGRRLAAARFVFLAPGDQVRVTSPGVSVTVYLRGGKQQRVTANAGALKIPTGAATAPPAGPGVLIESIASLFQSAPRPIAVDTQVRGPGALGARPTSHPLLPFSVQRLPLGSAKVSPVWIGGGETLSVSQGPKTSRLFSHGLAFIDLDAPAEGDFEIALRPGGPGWGIARVRPDQIPCPDWCPVAGPVAPADRLERALWLLAMDDPQWRLFAISEINALAGESLVAARVMQAIRTGETLPISEARP